MTCTEDRIENRNFREIDLEASNTAELQKYYNEVYKRGLHKYEYNVKKEPKRVLSAGNLKLINDAYKANVLRGERFLSRALETQTCRTSQVESPPNSTKATTFRNDLSSLNNTKNKMLPL